MTITEITDKIIKEADLNPNEYTVADRIVDINTAYSQYVELAVQIGSKEPPSELETFDETFSVVAGSNVFVRTIPNIPIVRVDFAPVGASTNNYCRVTEDYSRAIGTWCTACGLKFFANEKQIFVEEGQIGTLRVTYARGLITEFDTTDYSSSNPPSPDFLPPVFHPLLWMKPATIQASYYKKDRAAGLSAQLEQLEGLFRQHYARNSAIDSRIITDERGITQR